MRHRASTSGPRRAPGSVDESLAALPPDKRSALERLRRTIRSTAPKAEECISYGIPAFRLNGMLVGFGATARHCAFYTMSAETIDAHAKDLEGYETSKGTIRFQPDAPLPPALVRTLVKSRMSENEKG